MNEWADIQKIKAERETALIEQEKQKARNDQKIYKKHLDSIVFVKELEKEEAQAKKDAEGKEIINYVKNLKIQEKERKVEEVNKQKQYADIIEAHKNIHLLTKEQEKMRTRIEDQKYMNLMREKWESEDQRNREKNLIIKKQQQEILKMAEYQNELKSKAAQEAKLLEAKLLEERRLRDEKREKDHQDYLRMMNIRQQQKQNLYQSTLSNTQQKEYLINQWISNGIKQSEIQKEHEEKQEVQRKQEAKLQNQDLMQRYLQQKEKEKYIHLSQKRKEFEETLKLQQELKHSETVSRLLDQERKSNYRKQLHLQTIETKSSRTSPHALSPIEQKLNRDFIDRKANFLLQGGAIVSSPHNILSGFRSHASPVAGSKIFF